MLFYTSPSLPPDLFRYDLLSQINQNSLVFFLPPYFFFTRHLHIFMSNVSHSFLPDFSHSVRIFYLSRAPETYLPNMYFFYLLKIYISIFILLVYVSQTCILPYEITFRKMFSIYFCLFIVSLLSDWIDSALYAQ